MNAHFFEGIDGRDRSAKPRNAGVTMVIDWGFGLHEQEDLLTTGADYFDFAKIAVGISRLLPNHLLTAKLRTYQDHQIEPFAGGMFLEYAEVHGKAELYFPAVIRAGYRWVEVSDNLGAVSTEWKLRMIRQATEAHSLRVMGEVGKKEGLESALPFADDAQGCLDAGAEIVLLEAAELVSDDVQTARAVEAVVETVGLEKVMFELPGPWIAGVTAHDIHRLRRLLIGRYGSEVNLGNVAAADLMSLEAYRRGLGVNAGELEDAK
ncbi:MAG: phosphosulfolactate synthase [Candidatus Poribacteria bacterium]|nr:phosphosulfolactate synthase [Candidatus Poribacteria bacterium]